MIFSIRYIYRLSSMRLDLYFDDMIFTKMYVMQLDVFYIPKH